MSLYNALFGMNPSAPLILATLGLRASDVGRFRDAFVANGEIAIYTRNGGGNREEYQGVIDALARHPNYLRDADDDFDCTYATIYFSFPAEYADVLKSLDRKEPFDPDKRWSDYFEKMREPGYEPPAEVQAVMEKLVAFVNAK